MHPQQAHTKLNITLPDGSVRQYDSPVTGAQIAASIGAGLAKAAIAIQVYDQEWDLSREITGDAPVSIITGKDERGLNVIRHDTAHILAQAVQRIYPDAQVTIGPNIENGFFYDFAREKPFALEDLEKFEREMEKNRGRKFSHRTRGVG